MIQENIELKLALAELVERGVKMAKVYVDLINKKLRTLGQVPMAWREEVEKLRKQ